MTKYYKPKLTDTATPMLEVHSRMVEALRPLIHEILTRLGYYKEHNLKRPSVDAELSPAKDHILQQIATVLMLAAVKSEAMAEHILIATLRKVAKMPQLLTTGDLPADVEWMIASFYQRSDEMPATYSMDIVGGGQIGCSYIRGTPTDANIAKAATAAADHLRATKSHGRPRSPANRYLAMELAKIFRFGNEIKRSLTSDMKDGKRDGKLIYVEAGPFYDFLTVVLEPLEIYLLERDLPRITIESIIRFATEHSTNSDAPFLPQVEALPNHQ